MLKTKNFLKGYFLLSLLLVSSVNAQLFIKLLDRETIQKVQSETEIDQTESLDKQNNEFPISSLRLNTRDQDYDEEKADIADDIEDDDENEMEEEIIAEDENGHLFLLVPKDLLDSKESETIKKLRNQIMDEDEIGTVTGVDESSDDDDGDNDDNLEGQEPETTGVENDEVEDDNDLKIPSGDDDDDNDDDDKENDEANNESDDVGRGHKKKKIGKRKSVQSIKKPFRKFKRIIRRGIKHPKRTFKKVLKAIILPKSAVGILTSSMLSNAVGFGGGSLAGMSAGTIAGGIASGIFRNFGSFGKSTDTLRSKEIENRSLVKEQKVHYIPIAYLLANPNVENLSKIA